MPRMRYSISVLPVLIIIASLLMLFPGCTVIDKGIDFIQGRFSSENDMDAAVEVVDGFFQLLIEKDYEQAYEYLSSKDREENTVQDFTHEFSNVTDIVKVEINWVEVKNNIALVGIDIIDSYDGEEKMYKDIEVSLVKEEDESWKIVFWD